MSMHGVPPPVAVAGRRQEELRAFRESRAAAAENAKSSVAAILSRAWKATLALQLDEASARLDEAEASAAELPSHMAYRCRGEIEILRAVHLAFKDDSLGALSAVLAVGKVERPFPWADVAVILCRLGYWRLGDLDRVQSLRRRLPQSVVRRRGVFGTVFDLSIDAAIELEGLRVPAARRLALDAIALAEGLMGRNAAVAALPASIMAQILYEEGYIEQADAMIMDRLPAVRQHGTIEGAIRAYTVVARIAGTRRQFDLASMVLQEAEALGERRDWPRLMSASIAQRLDIWLQHGHLDEAENCVRRLEKLSGQRRSGDGFSFNEIRRFAEMGRCRVAAAQGDARSAAGGLRRLYHEAASAGHVHRELQVGIHLVQALAVAGGMEEARTLLLKTVETAAVAGFYRPLLETGPEIGEMLNDLYHPDNGHSPHMDGARSFVRSLVDHGMSAKVSPGCGKAGRAGVHLSRRELRILEHISRGYSNKMAANSLGIAPETVKSHVKHIFIKLAVRTRAEAVARGEILGLI